MFDFYIVVNEIVLIYLLLNNIKIELWDALKSIIQQSKYEYLKMVKQLNHKVNSTKCLKNYAFLWESTQCPKY